jgi:hypothetical protein
MREGRVLHRRAILSTAMMILGSETFDSRCSIHILAWTFVGQFGRSQARRIDESINDAACAGGRT